MRASNAAAAENGIAAFDGGGAQLASFTETSTRPSSLAVGEGSLWALGLDGTDGPARSIRPRTRSRSGSGSTRSAADIAAGAGAVWLEA